MLLLIDAGNTRVKWAVAAPVTVADPARPDCLPAVPGSWLASGAVGHDGVDTLATQWKTLPVRLVLVSNVAGSGLRAALEAQLQLLRHQSGKTIAIDWFASTALMAGIQNRYRHPAQLGCDRLASLIGARALRPGQALIVATCGTATTVDALNANGEFIGGLILPGLGVMATSLAQRTAQLPAIASLADGAATKQTALFADNTGDAIRNGCLAAQAGAIERAVATHGNAHCLLSGGAAGWIAPCVRIAATLVDNLVLVGLHVVASSSAGSASGVSGPLNLC